MCQSVAIDGARECPDPIEIWPAFGRDALAPQVKRAGSIAHGVPYISVPQCELTDVWASRAAARELLSDVECPCGWLLLGGAAAGPPPGSS